MEYWQIITEIEANLYTLQQLQDQAAKRSPLAQMIDKATGYDESQLEEAKAIVARIRELQAMLPPDDPHFKAAT